MKLADQPHLVVLIIGDIAHRLADADGQILSVARLGHKAAQVVSHLSGIHRLGDRDRCLYIVDLRRGALGTVQRRDHGIRIRGGGLYSRLAVEIGDSIAVAVRGGSKSLISRIWLAVTGRGAAVQCQGFQTVCGVGLGYRYLQAAGGRECGLRVIPCILSGDAGICLPGHKVVHAADRCDL